MFASKVLSDFFSVKLGIYALLYYRYRDTDSIIGVCLGVELPSFEFSG